VKCWLGKEYWDQGIAPQALGLFLAGLKTCLLYAQAARDILTYVRMLEKKQLHALRR
jgi:hypothetical protein